jgi:hypothetical protein
MTKAKPHEERRARELCAESGKDPDQQILVGRDQVMSLMPLWGRFVSAARKEFLERNNDQNNKD